MEEKERVEGQEPRLLSKEEVYDYQGETIDVGEKKTSSDAAMEEPEGIFGNSSSTIKIYQGNGSCLIVLVVVLLGIIGLVIALPVGLFILGIGLIVSIIRRLLR